MAEEPTAKKGKFYKSKYQDKWAILYPIGSNKGNSFAFFCIPCKKNVLCSHMGLADVKQHCKRKTHLKMVNSVKECRKLAFPSYSNTTVNDAQIHAEVLHTNFIVQHNVLFLTADHLAPLYKQMFPDSKIAKNLSLQPSKNNKKCCAF